MLAKRYFTTEEEFNKLREQEGVVVEMIGEVIFMSPAPAVRHQNILANLQSNISMYIKNTKCKSLLGINLRLFDKDGVKICDVIPDLSVFCNLEDEDYDKVFLEKIPKIIVEIISPSSVYIDNIKKAYLYKEVGVLEYWIVDTKRKIVTIWDFRTDEQFIYSKEEVLKSSLFEELSFNLNELFKIQ